jgi:hypothetical protein
MRQFARERTMDLIEPQIAQIRADKKKNVGSVHLEIVD